VNTVTEALDAVYFHFSGQKFKSTTIAEAISRFKEFEITHPIPKISKLHDNKGVLLVDCVEAVMSLKSALTKIALLGNLDVDVNGNLSITQVGSTSTEMVGDLDLLQEGSNNVEMTGDRNADITGSDNLVMTEAYNVASDEDINLDAGGAMNLVCGESMGLTSGDSMDVSADGPLSIYGDGVYLGGLKSGASQVAAGASSGELWIDTADLTLKMGV
jgi:hypothetical protein